MPEKAVVGETRTRKHIMNLIRDGALPSPITSALCSDKSCYACYVALEILAGNEDQAKTGGKSATAIAAYIGDHPEQKPTEKKNAEEEQKNSKPSDWKGKLYGAWKAAVPSQLRRSLAIGTPASKKEGRNSDFVKRSRHTNACYSCRSKYDSLYQEFSLYRYPQEPNELGAPLLRYDGGTTTLSDGAIVSRLFHIYINGQNGPARTYYRRHPYLGVLSKTILTDVALLELIDAPATTLVDFYKLQVTGFVHEVEANGTRFWARGSIFCDVEIMSPCMIEAAVAVRSVALEPENHERKIVSCVETIQKWLNIMGLDKKGFTVKTAFPCNGSERPKVHA
ncbi:hypothetical protein OESDEN_10649 [Oesophagostomum dentatum]|uniref:Uncharacterized protein n=1 Tax=Oesophagostomum dentatum TaxID=61180 RepID=A0A0B1T173_OESDE|nr:hypothetical protein OESDEN_10649 [Oesophagostomum dentatum]